MDRFQELIQKQEELIFALDNQIEAKDEAYKNEILSLHSKEHEEEGLKEFILLKTIKMNQLKRYQGKNLLLSSIKMWNKELKEIFENGWKEKKSAFIFGLFICAMIVTLPAIVIEGTGMMESLIFLITFVGAIYVSPIVLRYVNLKRNRSENSIEDLESEIKESKEELETVTLRKKELEEKTTEILHQKEALLAEKRAAREMIEFLQGKKEQAIQSVVTEQILNQKFDSMNIEKEMKRVLEKKEGEK